MTRRYRVLSSVLIVSLLAVAMGLSGAAAQSATAESSDITISNVGDTGESAITVDADNGVSIVNVEVSVDTSVAEITGVQEGADVDSSQAAQTFNIVDQTADSVRIEHANIQAQANPVQGFELAVVEFESVGGGETPVEITNTDVIDGEQNEYNAQISEGTLSVSSDGGEDDDGGQSGDDGGQDDGQQDDGGQSGDDGGQDDGQQDDGGQSDGQQADGGNGEGGSDGGEQSDGQQTDGGNGEGESDDGGQSDGQQADGGNGEGESDGGENTAEEDTDPTGEDEGLPGFTAIAALLAVSLAVLMGSKRKR